MPPDRIVQLMPKRCPKCGATNEDAALSCRECGSSLPRQGARSGQSLALDGQTSGATPSLVAGRYRLLQKLIQRRTSALFKAWDEQAGSPVALKLLETTGLVTPAEKRLSLSEFRREAKQLQAIRHPNLVQVLDFWVERDTAYVVMPWVQGRTLLALHQEGPIGTGRVRAIGAQIADALAFLHGQPSPIIMRDLKMSHVMLDEEGHAVLLDLGLTRFFRPGQSRGAANRGTAPYEAPEQAEFGIATPLSDIYALGTLLLVLAEGAGGNKATVDPALRQVLARARQLDPEKRYKDMAALRQALQGGVPLPVQTLRAEQPPPSLTVLTKCLRIMRRPGKVQAQYRLRLRNDGAQAATASIKPAVSWLAASRREITLAPGTEGQVLVKADLAQAPLGVMSVPQAILVESGSRAWVAVQFEEAEPALELVQTVLDFGQVGDQLATQTLVMRNVGGGSLVVVATTPHNWLRLQGGGRLEIAAGQQAQLTVELNPQRAPAEGDVPNAISIDSDQHQTWVGVRFNRGRPQLSVEPAALDFGAVRSLQSLTARLLVRNLGTGPLAAKVRSGHEALSVPATALSVSPAHQVVLAVTLNPSKLQPGEHLLDGVLLSGNGGSLVVPVHVSILRPLLAASDTRLEFGPLPPENIAAASQTLLLSNRGNAPLMFRVQPLVPWLQAWPSEARLEPSASTILEVHLLPASLTSPGLYESSEALRVESDGGSIEIGASVSVVKPVMSLEPLSLDFGVVPEGGVSERQLSVSNVGTGRLLWEASTEAAWLEIQPRSGALQPGERVAILTRAYALGLAKEAHEGRATIRVSGPSGTISVNASVAVSRPTLVAEPLVELGRSLDFTPVTAPLLIFNRGAGLLTGSASSALPWITVQPSQFSVPTGGSLALQVSATPPPDSRPNVRLPGAILIESNAGRAEVEVRLEVLARPRLQAAPDRLVLRAAEEGSIVVRNEGLGVASARVTTSHDWLQVKPRQLTIRPGQRAKLSVTVLATETSKPCQGAVVVSAADQTIQVDVEAV